MASPETFGLEIYPPDTPVLISDGKPNELKEKIAEQNSVTVIRAMRAEINPLITEEELPDLKAALEATDRELDALTTEYCTDARVIDHNWGLWAPPEDFKFTKRHVENDYTPPEKLKIPAGFFIVAEFEIVPEATMLDSTMHEIWPDIFYQTESYKQKRQGPQILSDVTPGQFVVNNASQPTYVDIEPRLRKPIANQK